MHPRTTNLLASQPAGGWGRKVDRVGGQVGLGEHPSGRFSRGSSLGLVVYPFIAPFLWGLSIGHEPYFNYVSTYALSSPLGFLFLYFDCVSSRFAPLLERIRRGARYIQR